MWVRLWRRSARWRIPLRTPGRRAVPCDDHARCGYERKDMTAIPARHGHSAHALSPSTTRSTHPGRPIRIQAPRSTPVAPIPSWRPVAPRPPKTATSSGTRPTCPHQHPWWRCPRSVATTSAERPGSRSGAGRGISARMPADATATRSSRSGMRSQPRLGRRRVRPMSRLLIESQAAP
jgi:hypothetical protein